MTAGDSFAHSLAVGAIPHFQYVEKTWITGSSDCNTRKSALPHAGTASRDDTEADEYWAGLLNESSTSSGMVMPGATSLMEFGGGGGKRESASAFFLEDPGLYVIVKSNKASCAAQRCSTAPNLAVWR